MKTKVSTSKNIILTFVLLVSSLVSFSQDRLFTYTYQSGVLGSGQRELEVWNTFSRGKRDYFQALEHRTELEFGLGKNLQTSVYLNIAGETAAETEDGVKSLNTEMDFSFSNEWKYKLLDAVADPIGVGLYGEYTFGSKEQGLEAKLIFDKKIDKMTYALNLVGEMVWAAATNGTDITWEKEKVAEVNLAMAYQVKPNFHLTLELFNANGFDENGGLSHSILSAGPGFSYSNSNLWVNFTLMPQVYAFKGATDGNLNLVDHERFQARLAVSYAF